MLCDPAPFFGPAEACASTEPIALSPWPRIGGSTLVFDALSVNEEEDEGALALVRYGLDEHLVPVGRLPPLTLGARIVLASPVCEDTLTHLTLSIAVGSDELVVRVCQWRTLEDEVLEERLASFPRAAARLVHVPDTCFWLLLRSLTEEDAERALWAQGFTFPPSFIRSFVREEEDAPASPGAPTRGRGGPAPAPA